MTPEPAPTQPLTAAPTSGSLANDLARGRTHMANERTHLAYLRTTVSLIGFGITINRFSLFLIQSDQAPKGSRWLLRDAGNAGLGMVLLGLALLVWSLARYWKTSNDIERGVIVARHRGTIFFTLGLLLLGGLTALWLFVEH